MSEYVPEQELAERRTRLGEAMRERGIDAMFVPPSSDLEYLTGMERDLPSFGQHGYAHGWVAGAFIAPEQEPLFVLPRMVVTFHLWGVEPPRCITVNEADDGSALFAKAARSLGPIARLGVGARTWGETMIEIGHALPGAELVNGTPLVNALRRVKSPHEIELMTAACEIVDGTMAAVTPLVQAGVTMSELSEAVEHEMRMRGSRTPSFPTHLFSFGYPDSHDSQAPSGLEPIREGEAVMFDFGAVHASGYSSDFGRTIVCGEPPARYADVYSVMLAAQEAGRAAAMPGALCREVNAACRAPIEEAGLGDYFRHRMGHGIGLDVHEQPYISVEDSTPLEPGMTFTDEPSIFWPEHFAVRCEDVVVCAEGGGRVLNDYPKESVVNTVQTREA
jgi:Xaa-Pro aminopeptidase